MADATALPLPDGATDLTMAPHMLYHVPDPAAAVRELRRVTRPGGRVLVVLNGAGHLRELREAMAALDPAEQGPVGVRERLDLDGGERLLARHFSTVTRHDFTAELVVPDPGPVAGYIRSTRAASQAADAGQLAAAVLARLSPGPDGSYRIATHSGCLVAS